MPTNRVTELIRVFRFWDAYFGYGRMLEAALIFVKLQFAALLMFVPVQPVIRAFQDIHIDHFGPDGTRYLLAIPFLCAALPSLVGLFLNATGFDCSRWFRIVGATVGMMIWLFILTKNVLLGLYGAGVNPWCTMGILGSLWIIRRGALGLPTPGAHEGL